jgi:hypothetical protein
VTIYEKDGPELLKPRQWGLYRKTTETLMTPAKGPLRCITKEGLYDLPAGWEGFIALDSEGYPYPVAASVQAARYEQVKRP